MSSFQCREQNLGPETGRADRSKVKLQHEEEQAGEALLCLEDKAPLCVLLLELGSAPALADNTMQINAADKAGRPNLFLFPPQPARWPYGGGGAVATRGRPADDSRVWRRS